MNPCGEDGHPSYTMKISDFGFPDHIRDSIILNGVTLLPELLKKRTGEVLAFRGIGLKGLQTIKDKLKALGLGLVDEMLEDGE